MGRIQALAVIVLLTAWLATATPAHAYDIAVQDDLANRSRTYTAYTNDTGSIFEIRFQTTQPGEKRRIRARLEVVMPSSASDVMLVARHAIRCGVVDNPEYEQLYGVRNVLRGTTMVQTPRYTFTAGAPGEYRCWLWIGSGRPRPSGTRTSSNTFRVGWGSYLHATVPVDPASAQSFTPGEPSHLLLRGEASDENAFTWTAPPSTSTFSASGDAYLTTCTSVTGSTDPVTGKRLCDGYTKTYGSKVNTRLIVGQLASDGSGYCALSYYPSQQGRQTYITKDIHHAVVYNSGSVPVRTNASCSRNFRIKVFVKVVDGAAVMVHRQGTITAALPAG